MFNKTIRQTGNYKLASLLLVLSIAGTAGCKLGQNGEQTASTTETQSQQPLAPPAPVVVDGVRTSYADVVQKTSPAVVRIEAEVKARQPQQQQQFNLEEFLIFRGSRKIVSSSKRRRSAVSVPA
jgi:S1-C subfamily serine protease